MEVLCLTYGEPPVNGWRPQYAYSLSILNRLTRRIAPIPRFVTPLIAARRAWIRSRDFTRLGWQSPMETISRRQVEALQDELAAADPSRRYNVRLVFEFRRPFLQEVLRELVHDPPDKIIMAPLYVADSDFTSGVSRRDLAEFRARAGCGCPLPAPRYLEGFGYDPRSGKLMADFIWQECRRRGWDLEKCRSSVLILGAHGTLVRPPAGINSGARETRYLFGQIRHHLRERFASIRLGWLNHTFGGEWTFPEVTDSARESRQAGIRNVVYFPFGFVADNGESQLEGRRQLEVFPWDDLLHLPCLNESPDLTRLLAARVLERLEGPPGDW